ncbi:MAG TPA: hypothetical protein VFG10_13875 [Saprospiraceae bacterium]|nr:hypothetical protein [Saprospiraceae bacterium]
MRKTLAWLIIYFLIPIFPFLFSGLVNFLFNIKVLEVTYNLMPAIYDNFDFIKLFFAIALISVLMEQNIRNYKPIIPSDPLEDKDPISQFRIIYILCFVIWGLLIGFDRLSILDNMEHLDSFINLFNLLGLIILVITLFLVIDIQRRFKFKVQ